MKAILLIMALALCITAKGQDTLQTNAARDTSSTYLIQLYDNTSLSGKILEKNSNEITFLDLTIGRVTIPMKRIEKITRLSGNQFCMLTLNDGKTFTGLILAQNDREITIETESLGKLTISNSKIREVKMVQREQIVDGKYFFPNPHATRYFFGPSAIPLKKGEGYFQNAYILANSVQIGVTDNFSMGGGIGIPFLFFVTPKLSYQVAKNLYAGGGILFATTITNDVGFGVGVAYGSLTLGNYENNVTFSAGWGTVKQEIYNAQTDSYSSGWEMAHNPIFTFSGMFRIARKCSLISENWVFATKEYDNNISGIRSETYHYVYRSIISGGFRLMGEKNSFDLAIAVPLITDGTTLGIPYLDYVFKF